MGFSVSAGNVEIASTFAFTSFRTRVTSMFCRTSIMTVHIPSFDMLKKRSMPSTPSMASSMRMQTPCSTSSGAAPRYGTCTRTIPGSIVGNSSLCMVDSEISPPVTKINIMRLAATGLSVNQAMTLCSDMVNPGWTPSWVSPAYLL